MQNVSIYEKKWIDLVFEGRNKSYGAYQLRNENEKTTLTALFVGFLLIFSLFGGSMLLSSFGEKPTEILTIDKTVILTKIYNPAINKPVTKMPATTQKKTVTKQDITKKDLVNPTVVKSNTPVDDVNTNKQTSAVSTPENGTESGVSTAGTGTGNTVSTGNETGTVIESKEPFNPGLLDKLPEFPGGIAKFYTYVGNNFEKPEIDEAKTIKILVAFVIEKDGSMTDIRVLRNPGYGLDKEAIRVLKSLKTKWTPGIVNGKPVRTAYNLPISVQML